MRLMFDCSYPRIRYKLFNEYELFDFYRDAKEAIPPNIPDLSGHKVSISMFVEADLAGGNFNRRSQTVVLVFMNKYPIHW